jgi:hypothetical protein
MQCFIFWRGGWCGFIFNSKEDSLWILKMIWFMDNLLSPSIHDTHCLMLTQYVGDISSVGKTPRDANGILVRT